MDSLDLGPQPIGWTELLAGTVATLFALASAGSLVAVIAGTPRVAGAAPLATLTSSAHGPASQTGCAGGPALGGMRLGTPRVYPQAGIRLEPVPFSVTARVSAPDAYREAALKPADCQAEELLTYYSGGDPPLQRVLAWAVVTSSACGSRHCRVTVAPVDATSGPVIAPTSFLAETGN